MKPYHVLKAWIYEPFHVYIMYYVMAIYNKQKNSVQIIWNPWLNNPLHIYVYHSVCNITSNGLTQLLSS